MSHAEKYQETYRVQTARVKWHDYDGGKYFVTICTKERKNYFGDIKDNTMVLSEIGQYLDITIQHASEHHPFAEMRTYVIMPNHLHIIIRIKQEDGVPKTKLSAVICSLKSTVTSHANKNGISFAWQSRFYDRIIRDVDEYYSTVAYIEHNVKNWADDEMYCDKGDAEVGCETQR